MGSLFSIALNVILALEQLTGMTMVVSERNPDIMAYRSAAASALCRATGDSFCGEELDFISQTTAAEGWSRIIRYEDDSGVTKSVCLLLSPSSRLTAADLSFEMSDGGVYFFDDPPEYAEARGFLMMHWSARCLDPDASPAGEKRADAFAAMAMALIQGEPAFTRYPLETPARKFAFFRNRATTEEAVAHAERWMLDIWKPEAVEALRGSG